MNVQPELSFPVHKAENNAESQRHLDANRDRFGAKCRILFDRLMAGERLTVLAAANSGISSLPRRAKDLADRGVSLTFDWKYPIMGPARIRVYYMTPDQIAANRLRFPA